MHTVYMHIDFPEAADGFGQIGNKSQSQDRLTATTRQIDLTRSRISAPA